MFPRITEYVHQLIQPRIQQGDLVIDATMGNGHDTVFLAKIVGDTGQVFAYDIQQQAIENTELRLLEEGLHHRVTLRLCSHDQMEHEENSVSVVVFNLGYLPGSDQSLTTEPHTTLGALDLARKLIKVGGLIVITVYWGHEQGKEEKLKVEEYVEQLPYPEYMVLKYQYINPKNQPPFVLAIEKRK
ncbi:class I SAM-dependent methyltransferase [Ammoniphilus sp. YIM 78166]|uniref:class I SAM-dependent methyltransferase n=1 Tax=Ammoniphilus sp. YIM 78166 TaxID=1644106 RepID=UPI00106FD5FB|nr:class I SAM-dependent methyltransferase [Ammoniphilus sp. YIM 78166]